MTCKRYTVFRFSPKESNSRRHGRMTHFEGLLSTKLMLLRAPWRSRPDPLPRRPLRIGKLCTWILCHFTFPRKNPFGITRLFRWIRLNQNSWIRGRAAQYLPEHLVDLLSTTTSVKSNRLRRTSFLRLRSVRKNHGSTTSVPDRLLDGSGKNTKSMYLIYILSFSWEHILQWLCLRRTYRTKILEQSGTGWGHTDVIQSHRVLPPPARQKFYTARVIYRIFSAQGIKALFRGAGCRVAAIAPRMAITQMLYSLQITDRLFWVKKKSYNFFI